MALVISAVVAAVLIVWLIVHKLIELLIKSASLPTATFMETEHDQVERPYEVYKLLDRVGKVSLLILSSWTFIAFWMSQDRHDSFFPIFLKPFLNPDSGSLFDLILQIGMWLAGASLCILVWLWFAEKRVGRHRITTRVIVHSWRGKWASLLSSKAEERTVVLTEPHQGAWSARLIAALKQPGTNVTWKGNEKMLLKPFPYVDTPEISYGFSDDPSQDLSKKLLSLEEDSDVRNR